MTRYKYVMHWFTEDYTGFFGGKYSNCTECNLFHEGQLHGNMTSLLYHLHISQVSHVSLIPEAVNKSGTIASWTPEMSNAKSTPSREVKWDRRNKQSVVFLTRNRQPHFFNRAANPKGIIHKFNECWTSLKAMLRNVNIYRWKDEIRDAPTFETKSGSEIRHKWEMHAFQIFSGI